MAARSEPGRSWDPTFVDIYGDQPPWEIFGVSEEKVGYFITPLKKRKSDHIRFCRSCAKGTWKGQTREDPIRKNSKGPVVGFRRSFKFETKEQEQANTWLMKEYFVGDDFFEENNIPKGDFAMCRIKKKKLGKDIYNIDDHVDVVGIIEAMLRGPDDCTKQDQVMEDPWDSIINGVCDQQHVMMDNQITTTYNEATTLMEKQDDTNTTTQQGHGATIISGILDDLTYDVPHDWWQQSHLLRDI
ncbi:unnamed protein product [Withania somnifera]